MRHMSHDKAIVRKQVERIDGVTKAWFEWIYDEGELLKVLVVEVSFDTDPNSLPPERDRRDRRHRGDCL